MELQYRVMEAVAGSSGVISSAMPVAGPRVCVPVLPGGTGCREGAAGESPLSSPVASRKPEGSMPFRTVSLLLS